MNKVSIKEFIQLEEQKYSDYSDKEIFQSLQYTEFYKIEEKKKELFKSRLSYLVLCKSLKEAMLRSTGFKQLKRYFVEEIGLDPDEAGLHADKYNLGCRIYNRLDMIIDNVLKFSDMDIRDLPINELALAHNIEWIRRRDKSIFFNEPL